MKKNLLAGKLQKDKTPTELTPEQVEQMHRQVLSKTIVTEQPPLVEVASIEENLISFRSPAGPAPGRLNSASFSPR